MKNNRQKHISIETVVAIGIGAAIVFMMKRWLSIPSGFPNTNIDTSYGFLGFFAILFGPVAGFFSGFLGHALNDFTQFGSPWWTWVFTTGFIGLMIGLLKNKLNPRNGEFGLKRILLFNVYQVIINIIGWFLIAPTGDILIYSEPANKVYLQGIISALSNSISTGVIGTILLVAYAATKVKKNSLKKE